MSKILLLFLATTFGITACDAADRIANRPQPLPTPATTQPNIMKINLKLGGKTFTATLDGNSAAAEFRRLLPLTLDMPDLNANEKHAHLPKRLQTTLFKPGTIRTGDLLLWGDDTLVLFYETFRSTYSYTRLGKLDDPQGLAEAVGTGSVQVTFEAQ